MNDNELLEDSDDYEDEDISPESIQLLIPKRKD